MKTIALVLCNEAYKRLLILWGYKFNIAAQLLTLSLIFIGASYFLGRGHFDAEQLPAMMLGYMVYFYARVIILSTGTDLISEASAGTLEQMYMSPIATEWLLLGRMLAQLISTTILALIPGTFLILLLHISIPLRWESLPVLGLTLAGLFGFTLVLTGLGLVFKQIDSAADLVQNLLLFLTGSFVPVSLFPGWLEAIARTLPTTQGIIVLRSVTLQGQSLAEVWASGSLGWLIVHTCLYLCTGWLVFKLCERYAKRLGSLGQY
jgi:ABC-2 type transport system permease protein